MPITEAQKKASLNYVKEHYDQICIKVKKGQGRESATVLQIATNQ